MKKKSVISLLSVCYHLIYNDKMIFISPSTEDTEDNGNAFLILPLYYLYSLTHNKKKKSVISVISDRYNEGVR